MPRLFPLLALVTSQAVALESALPVSFPADRYEKMAEKSPFALATPTAPVVAQQASFALHWFLTGAGRDPEGKDFITIKNMDGSVHCSLSGQEANADQSSPAFGVSLASVNWSDTFRETTAIIKKGAETAKLVFGKEEAVVAAQQPGAGRPPLPGQPMPPGSVRPGGMGATPMGTQPRVTLPRPSTAPVVNPPPPAPGQTAPGQPGGQDRRRIRNIAAPE